MSIDYSIEGAIAEIVINRPEQSNALDDEHFRALNECLERATRDAPRALLLRSEGRVFCAGRDISEIDPFGEDPADTLRRTFNALVMKVDALPMPSVAAVQGACVGAGTGIALACDLVVAADDATFTSPFGRLGSVPDSGFHYFMTTRLGAAVAKDVVLTGRKLSGAEAARLGLVARSVPSETLLTESRDIAASIASGPTLAFALACDLIDRTASGASLPTVLAAEAIAQARAFETQDLREGVTAFAERRNPSFTGS
jgi:enoyl-CoA hydratase/carnithine racemase